MRDFEDFLPDVLPHAASCPEPVALLHLRRAAQDFCTRTKLWREVDTMPATGAELETVCVPPYAALVAIESVAIDGRRLAPLRSDRADEAGSGEPDYYTQSGADEMRLVPCGGAVGRALRIAMILKPAEGAEMAPDFLYEHHVPVIAAGALNRILLVPGQTYSDPNRAAYFGSIFERGLDSLFGANLKGQQRANVRTRPRFF
jgi:hypothetical protein